MFATQIYRSTGEDFIPCDTVAGGATNISFAKNETCIYIQCSEFQATVDIPTALLRGYKSMFSNRNDIVIEFSLVTVKLNCRLSIYMIKCKSFSDYSHIVLVTEDGCVVKELDLRSSDGLFFVRLNIPFDSCGVKSKVNLALLL